MDSMTASEAVDPGSTPGGPTTLYPTAKAPKPVANTKCRTLKILYYAAQRLPSAWHRMHSSTR